METTASGNVVIPALKITPPTGVDGYLVVARELLQALEPLSLADSVPPRASALIAAHCLECLLKAFLLHKGVTKKVLHRELRHELLPLWSMARENGLLIPENAPGWVTTLASGHGPNFYFRYQEGENGTVVNGGPVPALAPMIANLKNLLESSTAAIQAGRAKLL